MVLDLLPLSPDRYVVIDHAHRSLVQAQAVREDELRARFEHCFCLTLLENHQGQHCQRLLKANTEYVDTPRHIWATLREANQSSHTILIYIHRYGEKYTKTIYVFDKYASVHFLGP